MDRRPPRGNACSRGKAPERTDDRREAPPLRRPESVPSGIVACEARGRYRPRARLASWSRRATRQDTAGRSGGDANGAAGGRPAAVSLAPDLKAAPFWCEDAAYPEDSPGALPARVDVLVVGAGYTGLSAARETARAGRSTLVLDAGPIGGGCSARNGGQVAFSIKPDLEVLADRHGPAIAAGVYREGCAAIEELRALAHEPGTDVGWRDCGAFFGARTRRHFEALKRALGAQPAGFEQRVEVVEPASLATATGSRLYHGGFLYPDDAAVHPLKLLGAYHRRAVAAGAAVFGHCPVLGLARDGGGFRVVTARGAIAARQVLLATNGYTGPLSPWHQRRVIPIGSYIIATLPLPAEQVERLLPRGRNLGDTRRVVTYVRPSPDGRRILFGGRARRARLRAAPAGDAGGALSGARGRRRQPCVDGLRRLHLRHDAAPRRARRVVPLPRLLWPGRALGRLLWPSCRPADGRRSVRRDGARRA